MLKIKPAQNDSELKKTTQLQNSASINDDEDFKEEFFTDEEF